MPIYTIKNTKTSEEWDITCSYEELQETLKDPLLERSFVPPNIVSTVGNLHSKTSDGFRDRLKRIKETSGKGNTIKI